MESDDGFEFFNRAIRTDPLHVMLAKWRQEVFTRKLRKLPDVVEVIASGSLARGTQIGPVHDIDLIVVFDRSVHPDYGIKDRSDDATESAQAAVTHLEDGLLEQLHPWRGATGGLLKETEQRTHVVKYRGDWVGPFKDIPYVPPVDVLPAVREGSHLLIPERGTGWIETDPERLMRRVEERKREWNYFAEVSGMVKEWARLNHLKIRNLAIDVMVLTYCPRPRLFETLSCGEGVAQFFEAAFDPKKAKKGLGELKQLESLKSLCKEIDPDINFDKLKSELEKAARLARRAMDAENEWKHRQHIVGEVIHPDEFWRELFGKKYPRTRKRYWRAPETEPWFGEYTGERRTTGERGESNGPGNPRPRSPAGGGGPGRQNRDPDDPRPGPSGPRGGPRRPSDRPPSPQGPRHRTERTSTKRTSAETGANLWTGIFGSSAATPSVPLTFG